MADLVLPHGDSLALSSTQLARFPLEGRYHTNTPASTAFVEHLRQTHAWLLYLSLLKPDAQLREEKHNTNLVQKQQ